MTGLNSNYYSATVPERELGFGALRGPNAASVCIIGGGFAGLGTALEVADAQRRLAQAEIDDSLARLGIWRARLAVFAAEGDITPLLTEASR